MPNYRLDRDQFNQTYQSHRSTIQQRQQQPLTAPMGNYRLDDQGQPILPSEYDQYPAPDYSQNIYHLADYQSKGAQTAALRNPAAQFDRSRHPARSANYRMDYANDYQRQQSYLNQSSGRLSPNRLSQQVRLWSSHQSKSLTSGLPKGKVKLLVLYLLIFTTMVVSGWMLMPFNKVNQVHVYGVQVMDPKTLLEDLRINPLAPVKSVMKHQQAIETYLEKTYPLVESVDLQRRNWWSLDFYVKEYQVVAKVQEDNRLNLLLSSGQLIENDLNDSMITQEAYDQLPLLMGVFPADERKNLGSSLSQIDSQVVAQMASIASVDEANKEGHIQVKMKDGNEIQAVITTFAQKVNYYPQILEQLEGRQGIIDLEVGAYFTPYQSVTNSVKLHNN